MFADDPGLGGIPTGGEGGGDGGGTAVVDPPVVDPAPGDEPAPGGEGGEPAPAGGEGEPDAGAEGGEPVPDENPYDGRKIDDATKKQIAKLRTADPNLAKTAADAIFSRKAVMAEFPEAKGVGEVISSIRELKDTIAAVGGQEGLTNLQTTARQFQTEMDQFASGDPKLLQELHTSNPDAFSTSISNGLNLLQELNGNNGDLFDKVMAVPFQERLQAAGVHTVMSKIRDAIKNQDEAELTKWVGSFDKWLEQVDRFADTQRGTKDATKMDPRERALQERENALKAQETERSNKDYTEYENKIGSDVNKLNNDALKPFIDRAVKDLNLKAPGAKRLTDAVQSEVWAKMKADKVFQRNAKDIVKKGDIDASAKFVNAKFKSLLRDTYQSVFNELYPNAGAPRNPTAGANGAGKPAPPAAGGGQAAKAPVNKVNYKGGRPTHEMVEWGKTPDEDWLRGVAVLKDGTKVTFDPHAPANTFR